MRRLLLLTIGFGAILWPGPLPDFARRGSALYHGRHALKGKIRGHDEFLPADAVRCANCHEAARGGQLGRLTAPRLDRSLLVDSRQRRGGPPSQYNRQSFCKLLRTGVDPASILIARQMPIYEMDEDQCTSLWIFLTGAQPDAKR